MMVDILDEVKKEYVKDLVSKGKRPSGRGFEELRKPMVEQNVIPNAEGSARVHWGKTQVLVGVKMGLGTPFPDRPEEGVLSTNAELLPLASPVFESGPPSAESIELARVVDRGIRSSNVIDLKSLFIEEGKVWNVFVDIYVLDHDGNLIDAAALAAMAALQCTKQPKLENKKVVYGQYAGNLKTHATCISTTFGKIGQSMLADPDLDEEKAMDARLTVSTTPTHICAMQKGGPGGITKDELLRAVDLSFEKGKELRALL